MSLTTAERIALIKKRSGNYRAPSMPMYVKYAGGKERLVRVTVTAWYNLIRKYQ